MVAPRVAALLLTGGASRRMGRDKAALVINGNRLAEWIATLLLQVAAPVIEVGPGYTALPQAREDPPGSGPLAAVAAGAAALQQARGGGLARPVLAVATDLPWLTAAFLADLAEYPAPSPGYSVVPRDAGNRPQPLCARYSPAALVRAQELFATGHRSMDALLAAVPVTWLDSPAAGAAGAAGAPSDQVLRDIDTPEDLAGLDATARP